jgi:hypothetical protein
MFYRFFMPDGDDAGGNMGGEAAPAADAPVFSDGEPETGGTTPEEVASVLKGAGIKVAAQSDTPPVNDAADGDDPEATNTDTPPPATPDSDHEETVTPAAPETPPAPADAATPETPDFGFTVENEEGQSFKVSPGDNLDDVLADFTPKNAGQLMEIIKQQSAAEAKLEAYNDEQQKAADEAARMESVASIQEGWDQEIKALQGEKRIEVTSDGSTPARVQEVFDFMGVENTKRAQAGRPQLASFEDALDKLENKERRDAAVQADKDAKATARSNGALVGGSSAPATGGPKPYVAGSARNVNQAIRAAGLI